MFHRCLRPEFAVSCNSMQGIDKSSPDALAFLFTEEGTLIIHKGWCPHEKS